MSHLTLPSPQFPSECRHGDRNRLRIVMAYTDFDVFDSGFTGRSFGITMKL